MHHQNSLLLTFQTFH